MANKREVQVKWRTRTTTQCNVFFVEDAIKTACSVFDLSYIKNEYILQGVVDGDRVELTDSLLKRVKKGATLELMKSYLIVQDEMKHGYGSEEWDRSRNKLLHQLCQMLPERRMPVRIVEMDFSSLKCWIVYPRSGSTVIEFKKRFEAVIGVPPEMQRLYTQDTLLSDSDVFPQETIVGLSGPAVGSMDRPLSMGRIRITIITSCEDRRTLWLRPTDSYYQLTETYHFAMGVPPGDQQFDFQGQILPYSLTNHKIDTRSSLSDCGMQDGSELKLRMTRVLRIAKPVIYLLPLTPLPNVAVTVRLVPQWSFTHIYPLVTTKQLDNGKQELTWDVSAHANGTLVERGTGLELSYLFWEASPNSVALPTPPLSPFDGATIEHFDPAYPLLAPSTPTIVLLPFGRDLLRYLDSALRSLTLHTSARNDFITYWLPSFQKHTFVALRFVPQAEYERAAELHVQPEPDVVTRVFMLFRGVAVEDAGSTAWAAAKGRVGEVKWDDVVGVRSEASDQNKFRVLEWGGMEVL